MTERILYLHGFASSPQSKKAVFFRDRFAACGVTVDIPDLAQDDFEHLTITRQLRVVEQAARGEPVALMGSSLGGYLAALYAARHAQVTRVALLAPAFGFARRWPLRLGGEVVARWRETGWMDTFHYADNRPRRIHYGLLEDGLRYEEFPDVRQAALIVHGRNDDVVPCVVSEEFVVGQTNATLEIVDSGHELTDQMEFMWGKVATFFAAG